DGAGVAFGAGLVAVLFCLTWLLGMLGAAQSTLLGDRVSMYLGARVGRLVATAPGIGHFENAADLADLDQVRGNRSTLAGAPRQPVLAEQVGAGSVQAAVRSAGWEAAGWLGYAAGFIVTVVALVVRAAHGLATPGQVVMAVSLIRRAQTQVSRTTDTAGSLG